MLGSNIVKYDDKSLDECKKLCTAVPNCLAFEFYEYHGGTSTISKPKDCWLQSRADSRRCNGRRFNFDLYVKGGCTYGTLTNNNLSNNFDICAAAARNHFLFFLLLALSGGI